jgi:hypothetical protein
MADIRIEGQEFTIGRWHFPVFAARGGECVSLCFPKEASVDADRIIACLTGAEPVPGLKLHTTVLFAKPASSPTGWRRWFQDPTPFAWLKKNTSLSEDAIRSFLLSHKMNRRIPVSQYAGTPRTLLGLQAAYARRPGVVVFSTSGLDPLGVRETFRVVADKLLECAAIYLAWPYVSQGQEQHNLFPGSMRITVFDEHQPSVAR